MLHQAEGGFTMLQGLRRIVGLAWDIGHEGGRFGERGGDDALWSTRR